MRYVLVTGCNGMIGRQVLKGLLDAGHKVLGVDTTDGKADFKNYIHVKLDLTKVLDVEACLNNHDISHVIHLAAMAHKAEQSDLSWSQYYRVNTLCAKTIFDIAEDKNIPVFLASTVDVYGITEGVVTADTKRNPIGYYAKSKFLAENALIEKNIPYTIARFAPVYTEDNMGDIYKRYYLRSPMLGYRVGQGITYEFLNIDNIVKVVITWLKKTDIQQIIVLCDKENFNTKELIKVEKSKGKAKFVLPIPLFLLKLMKFGVSIVFGKNNYYMFLISKIIAPIKLTREKHQGYGL